MKKIRIIPRLDVKGPRVVKGIHLEGLRVVGDPRELATKYYEAGADELLYIDIVASLYERNNLLDIVKNAAENILIPMTVGGGIRTLDDINRLLRAGADKVAINTAATRRPKLISEASQMYGAQCIVGSIEAIRKEGHWEAYVDNGREKTGLDALDWANELIELGAGELLVTSIDKEGTEKGFDVDLVGHIARKAPIPVIASGGAGNAGDLYNCIVDGAADAVSVASLLHYDKITIEALKHELHAKGVPVRLK